MDFEDLTTKAKSFYVEMAKGKTQKQAVIDSEYNTDPNNDNSLKRQAKKCMDNPAGVAYIAELKKPAQEKHKKIIDTSIEAQYEKIQEAWDCADTTKDKILVVEVINKMKGYHAPKEIEVKNVRDSTAEQLQQEIDEILHPDKPVRETRTRSDTRKE